MNTTVCTKNCYDYSVRLHANLSARTTSSLVPSYDTPNEPIVISVLFSVIKILSLLFGLMMTAWVDPRMRWNPADHMGISSSPVDKENIWTPTFTLLNPAKSPVEYKITTEGVRVMATGNIVAPIIGEFVTACNMQLVDFPFDRQTCLLEFTSFHIAPSLWRVAPMSANASLDFLSNSSADPWHIVSTEFRTGFKNFAYPKMNISFPTFTIAITLARSPLYYVANLILPTVLLMILVAFVFIMPPGCDIKVELSATLALSLYVLQQVISAMLPTNDKLPYCQTALNASLVLSGVSLITSIISYTLRAARIRLPLNVTSFFVDRFGSFCMMSKYRRVLHHRCSNDKFLTDKPNDVNQNECLHQLLEAKEDDREQNSGDLAEIRKMFHELLELKRMKLLKTERENMHKAVWSRIDIVFNFSVLIFYVIAVIYTTTVLFAPHR